MKELWKNIKGYEERYQISNLGRVKSIFKKEIILKPEISKNGYILVHLSKNGKKKHELVHRLLALAFISNPGNKLQVNHKNGIKVDNNITNLEWVTCSENLKHAFLNGLNPGRLGHRGINNSKSKKIYQIDKNTHEIINEFYGIVEAGRITKANYKSISACCNNKKHRKTAGGYIWKFAK